MSLQRTTRFRALNGGNIFIRPYWVLQFCTDYLMHRTELSRMRISGVGRLGLSGCREYVFHWLMAL